MTAPASPPPLAATTSGGSTYALARRLFGHGLGIVFFFAFLSIAQQMRGLFGAQGIAPVADFLPLASAKLGAGAYWEFPSVFWLNSSDGFLVAICWIGTLLSLVLAAGFLPGPISLLLWALYLSLNAVGAPFLEFQWDALLLEAGLIAALYLPWQWRPDWARPGRLATLGRWLLWWLTARLMFESGVVKLSSGDPTWRNLTAMTYHYETQPLPLWTAWYAHHAPLWVHKLEVIATFAIEFLAPLGLLVAQSVSTYYRLFLEVPPPAALTRSLRNGSAIAMIALQVVIASTGNFAFFNLLTALLCLPLLDDAFWPARWRGWLLGGPGPFPEEKRRTPVIWGFEVAGAVSVLITAVLLVNKFNLSFEWPRPIVWLVEKTAPLRSFNSYGLFAVMTTERMEIEVQGSDDAVNWYTYQFKWKPGDLHDRPKLVAPFQPRLDWQMWFASLGSYRQNPWFMSFLQRLLQGSPAVLGLLETNPFPHHPPKYIRSVGYDYHFSDDWGGAAWWRRDAPKGLYAPIIHLRGPEDAEAPPESASNQ